eukprot:6324495-Prymnesium_polylepis.2
MPHFERHTCAALLLLASRIVEHPRILRLLPDERKCGWAEVFWQAEGGAHVDRRRRHSVGFVVTTKLICKAAAWLPSAAVRCLGNPPLRWEDAC